MGSHLREALRALPARIRRVGPSRCRPAGKAAVGQATELVPGGDRLQPRQGCPTWPRSGGRARSAEHGRARPSSKHHVLVDGQGISLAVSLTGGNRNGITQLMPLLAKVPSVAGLVGRPRRRPDKLLADRGDDHDTYRRLVWAQGIEPVIARRGVPHGSGLGVHRCVVERTIAWLHGFRRLRVRWERRDDIHEAFLAPPSASSPTDTSNAFVRASKATSHLERA
ncbi:transposase [Streptomyces sp. c-19]|uniref:transposase n=1 Tax=Streptomyces sp. c-19 TaxID=2789275 RepID=UPI00397F48CA